MILDSQIDEGADTDVLYHFCWPHRGSCCLTGCATETNICHIFSIELDFYKRIQREYVLQYSNHSSRPSTVGMQPFLAMYKDVETRITLIIFLGHKYCESPLKRQTYTNCHLLVGFNSIIVNISDDSLGFVPHHFVGTQLQNISIMQLVR